MPVLAQTTPIVSSLWIWIGVLIVVVLVGAVVILAIRRRLLDGSGDTHTMDGTLLERIERMRREGEISDEEFRRARDGILGRERGDASENGAPADR